MILSWPTPSAFASTGRIRLVAGVDFPDTVLLERQCVERFQLEVQDARRAVGTLQGRFRLGECFVDTFIGPYQGADRGIVDQFGAVVEQVLLRHVGRVACSPGHLHFFSCTIGGGEGVGIHHHPAWHRAGGVIEGDALEVAFHAFGGGIVDGHHLGAVACGRQQRAGMDHALDARIDAIAGAAVGLRGDIDGQGFLADQPSLGRFLERDSFEFIRRKAAGEVAALDDLGITDRPLAGLDPAVACGAGSGCNAEQPGALLDQGDAAGGTSLA